MPEQIRLIHVEPGFAGNRPSLIIEHFDLATAPPFNALSYTWGHPYPQMDLSLNALVHQVSSNLYYFLDWLGQQTTDTSYYWIDQICINQNHLEERNHQVSLMKQIYSGAAMVVIWLGPAGASDPLPMYLAEHVGDTNEFYCSVSLEEPENTTLERWEIYDHNDKILKGFLYNDYWNRLWIVQEVLLAQQISIACVNGFLPWSFLRTESLEHEIIRSHSHTRLAWLLRQSAPTAAKGAQYEGNRLLEFVTACRLTECKDVRDKIFGLQGLLKPEQQIVVDYNKSIADVYNETVRIILRDTTNEDQMAAISACKELKKTMLPEKYDM